MQEDFSMLGYLAIALGCGMIGYFLARKMFWDRVNVLPPIEA